MTKAIKSRRVWTFEEKLFFIQMLLTVPVAAGLPKKLSLVSTEYNISQKTLYQWIDIYNKFGPDGFKPKPRKESESKFRNPQLVNKITKLALHHPEWSARAIVENLSADNIRITIPTVQKILRAQNRETISKRFAATEWEFTKKGLELPQETIDLLIKNNPFLDLYFLNRTASGLIFYVKAISLDKLCGKGAGYILAAVETNSLDMYGSYWDGEDGTGIESFAADISHLLGGNYKRNIYFRIDKEKSFSRFRSGIKNVKWFDVPEEVFPSGRYSKALRPIFETIKRDFFRGYQFSSVGKLHDDLNNFLLKFKITPGPIGYPTFGRSPYSVNQML